MAFLVTDYSGLEYRFLGLISPPGCVPSASNAYAHETAKRIKKQRKKKRNVTRKKSGKNTCVDVTILNP